MKILNYGSLNIDLVYALNRFPHVGETMHSDSYEKLAGGKGLNQSVAVARAGQSIFHAGKVGGDGQFLIDTLKSSGVNVDHTFIKNNASTGHAMIQLTQKGENIIILYSGTNFEITEEEIDSTLSHFSAGDFLLLQNEINHIPYIIKSAKKIGMRIIFNPAPMTSDVLNYPLDMIDILVVNEVEGELLTGKSEPSSIIDIAEKKFPESRFVLTLGEHGVMYRDKNVRLEYPAVKVQKVVDTTAAGDTFIGYFVAGLAEAPSDTPDNIVISTILERCMKACAICVTRKGASQTIPTRDELKTFNLYEGVDA